MKTGVCLNLLSSLFLLSNICSNVQAAFVSPKLSDRLVCQRNAMKANAMVKKGVDVQPPRPNENTYWVTDQFLAGEYPTDTSGDAATRRKLGQYLDSGVSFFLDLTRQGEKESYNEVLQQEASTKGINDVDYRRMPVQDFGIPSKEEMRQILDTIDEAIAKEKKVYVHCRGGIGRTGTTVGCYLARHGNSGAEALEEVNRLFQSSARSRQSYRSPETNAQEQLVLDWAE